MEKYIITVTSECISAANGRPYDSDKFEASYELPADSKLAALDEAISLFRIENRIDVEVFGGTEYNEYGAVIGVELPDGGRKDYFFDMCEVTE